MLHEMVPPLHAGRNVLVDRLGDLPEQGLPPRARWRRLPHFAEPEIEEP